MDSKIFFILFVSSGFSYIAYAISCIKCKDVKSISSVEKEGNYISHECEYVSDSCFVHIANQTTVRRGCLKESIQSLFSEGINLIDDCKDKYTCQLCLDRDDCNNIEVRDESCIDCQTETDLNCTHELNEKMSRTCQRSVEPRGCYLRKASLSNIQRGCLSDLDEDEREICLKEGSKCKTCVGNNCNLEMKFQSCYVCDTNVDGENCKSNVPDTMTKLCQNHLAECFINVENNTVSRGCLGEDMPEESCTSGKCSKCSRLSDCNGENIHAEMCITCDSATDPACQTNATHFANQACPLSAGPEGCYHHIGADGHHIRGCVSSLYAEQKHECQRNSTTCKTCLGNKCNSKSAFTQCMTCNSASDPNCIEHHGKASIKTCQTYDDECFVFTRNNFVRRGCLEEMNPELLSDCIATYMQAKCQTCKNDDGSACNNHNLTDTCIECDSSNDVRCRDDPASMIPRICSVKANKSAGCYLHKHGDTFRRGCLEDLDTKHQHECYKQSDTCKSCFGRNCNTAKNYKTCYVCNSRNDPYCAKASDSTHTSSCLNYLSSCVTGIENGYTYRNCTENIVTNEKTVKNELEICSSDKCNGIVLPPQRLQCYQCSGNEECGNISKNSNITAGPCQFYSELDQCYTLMNYDHTVHRGCISDLDTYRFLCDKKGVLCKKCNQSGCNYGKIEPDSHAIETETPIAVDGNTINSQPIQSVTETADNSSNKLTGSFILITLILIKFF
ncbi:proprotein convertase subtilisin/kexin type 5-like [Sitodiplosis mosellana]|uniref:proprotein convertase subtilisin/kexin type 5-like n=1 Tax=Sitodiplosis mosellana TaxID=263140 RepID=UPI0024443887|nr:proprotein convertase subtilisin/kexin type 5-like [Sitodiplosis mosellana]